MFPQATDCSINYSTIHPAHLTDLLHLSRPDKLNLSTSSATPQSATHPTPPHLTTHITSTTIKMPTTPAPKTTNAGIASTNDGRRIIPASTRADGSVRKEQRVRPGYRPPEDVELYRNRYIAGFKEKGKSGGVPGATPVEVKSEALSKNAKKRAAKKRNKEEGGEEEENLPLEGWTEIPAPVNNTTTSTTTTTTATTTTTKENQPSTATAQEDKEKQVRNLKKKIRQGMELKEKRARGEPLVPDQLAKLVGLNELISQLKKLGVDYGDEAGGDTKKEEAGGTEGGAEK